MPPARHRGHGGWRVLATTSSIASRPYAPHYYVNPGYLRPVAGSRAIIAPCGQRVEAPLGLRPDSRYAAGCSALDVVHSC